MSSIIVYSNFTFFNFLIESGNWEGANLLSLIVTRDFRNSILRESRLKAMKPALFEIKSNL